MYKHVLLPIAMDHNPHFDEAMEIARLLVDDGGKITGLHVIESIPSYVEAHIPQDIQAENLDRAKAALKDVLAGQPGAEAVVIHGHAAQSILETAENSDVDCIVIASHRPGLQDYFIGSTAARVVRHAQCAVHVLR